MDFKLVEGFNGRYAVTKDGKVFSMCVRNAGTADTPQKELVPTDNKGYLRVALRRSKWDDPVEGKYVHRLVAEAYLEKPEGAVEVNHIDGNKGNNCVDNLEWVDHQTNIDHAWATGLVTVDKMIGTRTLTIYKGVCKRTGDTVYIHGKQGLTEAGFDATNVLRACSGLRSSHKGMTWSRVTAVE